MRTSSKALMGCVVAVVIVTLALIALLRVEESRSFSEPHRVQRGGTNYVVQLVEATVGRTDSGCVVIVYARFENANPYEVVLPRTSFVLTTRASERFEPVVGDPAPAFVRLPAGGVLQREMLSFNLPADALGGSLELRISDKDWVTIKSEKPFTRPLRSGEFVSFRVRDW